VRTNLSCEACRRELTALVDGAIHPAVARAMMSHVEECAGCRARLEEHRAIAAFARRLPSIEAPAWLEQRVVSAVTRPARIRSFLRRSSAAALAASFAITVGLLGFYPRIAAHFDLPSPAAALARTVAGAVDLLVAIPKHLAAEVTFYGPMARQVWLAFQALAALPRAALVVLQSPDAQTAGIILLTLGVAIYWILRPSRSHERGIGHACLAL
jgi:anti-sigma factor RsiW